jgi:hypothetical protein
MTASRASRLAWALCAVAVLGLALTGWFDHLIREAGRPDLAHWRALDAIYAVLGLGSPALVGAVVASRRPGHPVGWLLLVYGVLVTASLVAGGYLTYALLARPGALPGAGVAVVVYYVLNLSGAPIPLLALAVLLTPTGALPSPRWRWLARALVVIAVASLAGGAFNPEPLEPPLQSVTSPLAVDLSAGRRRCGCSTTWSAAWSAPPSR